MHQPQDYMMAEHVGLSCTITYDITGNVTLREYKTVGYSLKY